MVLRFVKPIRANAVLAALAWLVVGGLTAHGQSSYTAPPKCDQPAPPTYRPWPEMPAAPTAPITPAMPGAPRMPTTPSAPTTPSTPSTPTTPGTPRAPTTPGTPSAPTSPTAPTSTPEPQAPEPSLGGEQGTAGAGSSVALAGPGGYLDSAIPQTMFRMRYDAGFDMNRPDRATYFYATWAETKFHPHAVQNGGVFFDPKARGTVDLPARVDYQEAYAYMEYAANCRFSGFLEVPYRYINLRDLQEDNPESEGKRNPANAPAPGSPFFPEPDRGNEAAVGHSASNGISDLQFGFKYALVADPDQYLTFQLRGYSPTGSAGKGLGTGHWSVEPSLLYYQRLTDRLVIQGQFTDWNPIEGGPAAGPILMYGVGLGYDVYQCGGFRITPVTEFVGWTVLYGFQSFFGAVAPGGPTPGLDLPVTHGVENAAGDTIINAKIGVRTYFENGSDLYIGYGRALTGDRWYKELFRVEYRMVF